MLEWKTRYVAMYISKTAWCLTTLFVIKIIEWCFIQTFYASSNLTESQSITIRICLPCVLVIPSVMKHMYGSLMHNQWKREETRNDQSHNSYQKYKMKTWVNTDYWTYQGWDQVARRCTLPSSIGHTRRESYFSNDYTEWSVVKISV